MGRVSSESRIDFDLHGMVGIRLVDPLPADVASIERQLGRLRQPLDREPDIVVRYVESPRVDGFRHIEVGSSGHSQDGYWAVDRAGRPAVRIPMAELGGPCEFVCKHGTTRLPLLRPAVRLAALHNGHLPIHGSAFEYHGRGVLVSGWSRGGKTSATVAFGENGGAFVADDLILLDQSGEVARGLPTPLALSAAQLAQLRTPLGQVHWRRRKLMALLHRLSSGALPAPLPGTAAPRAGRRLGEVPLQRMAARLERRLKATVPLEAVFRGGIPLATSPRTLFLMVNHESRDVVVERADASSIAARVEQSMREDDLGVLRRYLEFLFAFPDRVNPRIERAHELRAARLQSALGHLSAYIVRHPHPAPLSELFLAMRPYCEPAAPPALEIATP